MVIRTVKTKDFQQLVQLYKQFFPIHNQFQKNDTEIILYLKEQAQQNIFLILEDHQNLKGALILVLQGQNKEKTHLLWKYRHCAFASEKDAMELLTEAEKRIRKISPTAKVELTIAENEKGIKIYTKKGYIQEGKLKNHYRWGEACYILSKSFK